MTAQFTIKGIPKLMKNLKGYEEIARRVMGRILYREGEVVMAQSKQLVPVDMGVLRASGRVEFPVYTNKDVTVTLSYGGAASGYAVYVHEGIGPAAKHKKFFPSRQMADALEAWAKRHGLEGLGFVIARNIGQKGIKPTKYLERPLLAHEKGLQKTFAEKFDAEMQNLPTERITP